MGKIERKFNEKLILNYKENPTEELFVQIISDKTIKKYITYVCNQKLKNAPTTLYSLEDLKNISYLVIWQAISKFRFICPICGIQAKSESTYKLHCITKHNEYMGYKVSISRYIKFNLGAYLQNEIRKEYSLERKSNVMTISIYSPEGASKNDSEDDYKANDSIEFDIASERIFETEFVFKEAIHEIKERFDPLSKEIFDYMFNENKKQNEIAEIFCRQGRYSSEQSAAVVISRTIKKKINPIIASLYPELIK